ncbi:hypothetical protein F2Q69_00048977, partial [Brassica cretica]
PFVSYPPSSGSNGFLKLGLEANPFFRCFLICDARVCGALDYKDAESHLKSTSASSSNKCCNNGSGNGSDDAQELWLLVGYNQVTAVTVIPAIKGSREMHGKSLEKLSVSWAEDVYDPPPSLVSHTRSKKQQPQKSKKNGKKGQKGSSNSSSSSSRGSKDKKSSSSSRSKHSRDNKFGWATQTSIVAASS